MLDDDVVMEPEDGEGSTATPDQKLKKLREERDEARAKRDEYLAGWQRTKADYVNLERRMRSAGAEASKIGAQSVALGFIPALDSLEAAAKGTPDLGAVLKQADGALKEYGIVRFIASAGDVFDPVRHEAVQTLATEKKEDDNTVTECLQSGYELEGTVVRPARVIVKHYQESSES